MSDENKVPEDDTKLKDMVEEYADKLLTYHVIGQSKITLEQMLQYKTEFYDKLYAEYVLKSKADKQREEVLKPIRDMWDIIYSGTIKQRLRKMIYAVQETLELADKLK